MKEWMIDQKKKFTEIFYNYGKISFIIVLSFSLIILLFEIIFLITPQKLRVSFLDVGQGDAIFIQTPSGKEMLIDGGGTNIILERLSKEISFFDKNLDLIVATHPDADHVTGLIPVMGKYKVEKIITSPRRSETGIFEDLEKHIENEKADVYIASEGDIINFNDGVVAKILWPEKNYLGKNSGKKNDTNDASISMVITYGNISFLLTGDLPGIREQRLISNGLNKNITVYKLGHHGSKTSSSEQLLSFTRPEYAIVSAGKDNKYGHPNEEIILRVKKYAKEILSTIDHGTISFITDGRLMEVETQK